MATDASVAWAPEDWTTVGAAGSAQLTPDLTAIIQEIVSRDGWAALNDMVFIITGTGTRTAEAFDGSATAAPLLRIEWLPPGPISDPVIFDTPPDADAEANQIGELAAAGTLVGITAAATDPDSGDIVTYIIDDPRFAIDALTGVITRSGTGTLDFETEPSITLTVTATSSDWSKATQAFAIDVLDDPEPAVFNDPPDADPAADRIAEDAAAGTAVGITASAMDPDSGDTISYSLDDLRFTIDATTGVITRSNTGTLDPLSQPTINLAVTASSSDGSFATENFTVSVTSNRMPSSLTLVNAVDAWNWNPPSPDSSGIAYISHLGTLLISDGEVDELGSFFTGENLYEMSLSGSLLNTLTTIGFSDEPTGVAYNPLNKHLFFSDDTGTRSVYELDPGEDGLYDTSDDIVTSFSTSAFGNTDPEGLAYDVTRGVLYIADGAGGQVYTVSPGQNGVFDGVPSAGGDDIVTSFDTDSLGIVDPEGIEYDPVRDVLYIIATQTSIAVVTPTGELLGMLDTSEASMSNPAGLALGPSSVDPDRTSLYVASRGSDSNAGNIQNDGTVHEFLLEFEDDPSTGPTSDPVAFNTPSDTNSTSNRIAELAAAGALVGISASASDPDAGDTVAYSVDDARFDIDSATGVVTRSNFGSLDFETEPSIIVTVTATSSDGSAANQTFSIEVLDDPEAVAFDSPADADFSANRITETDAAGTTVGITAAATDPDVGSTVTYSLEDERFTIDSSSGVISRSGTGVLDADLEPQISLAVTATSSDGSTATRSFTINVVPEEPQVLFTFAVFGDFGDADMSGEAAVAELVNSWNVDFILTAGDNAYDSVTYEDSIGQYYSDYIGNYTGIHGPGSAINRFFPILGNHDYEDPGAGLDAYLSYFTLPDNERYYDFQVGSVHFFALNSYGGEPDGNEMGGPQAQWLEAGLSASEATLNVVYFHDTAYTSDGGGDTDMRWSYEEWGADAIFAGNKHDFDLVVRDDNGDGVGLPYVTSGLGGSRNEEPHVGANLVTVTDAGMLIEFYMVDGTLWDSYFVEAPAGGNPQFVNGHDVMNGSSGSDYLWGLGGNDTLTGFAGDDMMIGGDGDDMFVFHVGDGSDIVADFVPGSGTDDMVDLRDHGIDSLADFLQLAANQGPDVVADLGGGDQIVFLGAQVEQFHDDDFVTDILMA
jgi:hypothetical protein